MFYGKKPVRLEWNNMTKENNRFYLLRRTTQRKVITIIIIKQMNNVITPLVSRYFHSVVKTT